MAIRQPPKIPLDNLEIVTIIVLITIAFVVFILYLMYRNGTVDENATEGATHRIHYNLTAKESENLLKNSAISFAIMLILGYIIPVPYNGFSLLGTATAFMLLGLRDKK